MAASLPVPVGTVVGGKYRIERLLGAGGMGVVVQATHVALGQGVALKVLRSGVLSDSEARRRFMREARATFALKSPHTVRLLDVDEIEPLGLVMVMELLEGQSLREIIHARAPLPEQEAALYVRQVCRALSEAHNRGVVHRDIKPGNLVVTRFENEPWIKVLDFGLSKGLEGDPRSSGPLTAPAVALGTPRYMAPEQWTLPAEVDGRTDLYSLGVVLYQMLTGTVPFGDVPAPDRAVRLMAGTVPSPRTLRPELSEHIARITLRCLRPVPDERFASADALEAALRATDDHTFTGTAATRRKPPTGSQFPTAPDDREAEGFAGDPPNTEREPRWDLATTPRRPGFDFDVFTGTRVHEPREVSDHDDSSFAAKGAPRDQNSDVFDLSTEVSRTSSAVPRARKASLGGTLPSEGQTTPFEQAPTELTARAGAEAPKAAPFVPPPSASGHAHSTLGPTQPRMQIPKEPRARAPGTTETFRTLALAIVVAFALGVGLAFLVYFER